MIIAFVPAIFAVVGLLLYILATNPKLQEIGKLTFFAGFLVTMFTLASKTVHLFSAVFLAVVLVLAAIATPGVLLA